MEKNYTKIEVAEAQLFSAIYLYGRDIDHISVHTLAHASLEITRNLLKKIGKDPKFDQYSCDFINHELLNKRLNQKNAFYKIFFKARNFFKHADRDPEEILEFDTKTNEITLLFACETLTQYLEDIPFYIKIFYCWMIMKSPELFQDGPYKEKLINEFSHLKKDKNEFFSLLTSLHN